MDRRKLAVFDIDGTLYRYALHHAMVDSLIKDGLFSKVDIDNIEEMRRKWKHREDPEGFWDFVVAQNDLFFSTLSSIKINTLTKSARKVAHAERNHVFTYVRDLLNTLHEAGYFIIAISGSPAVVVKPFCESYPFDHVVAGGLIEGDTHYTGERVSTHEGKHIILQRIITDFNLTLTDSYAVGDTDSDISLLEMVDTPIAFNPNKQLLDHAKKVGWKIVIERKNSILELVPIDGHHILK